MVKTITEICVLLIKLCTEWFVQTFMLQQTCKNLVDNAFNACSTGIRKAQDQCLSVMGALGTVYHHARDVLDRINPDRWSSKQQQQQQQQQHHQQQIKKRQVLFKDGRYGNHVMMDIQNT